MYKKEIVAMLLAGGQGSRLGILTKKMAKPSVSFGGKYKIIDFALSNCINSGIDTVGVLTQYQPLSLNTHIGIGIPWDLDRNFGGVTVLPPFLGNRNNAWYTGTANAVYQNIPYVDYYDTEHVIILSGDHIYKMDYASMLDKHKEENADATIAVLRVPMEEAFRFGIMNTNEEGVITEFEEKPANPKSDLASMGIYIFRWDVLKKVLIEMEKRFDDSDFGKHVIPYFLATNKKCISYEFEGYWKDVGTLEAYWKANMELIEIVPDFNLYEPYWKIYTKNASQPPQYFGVESYVETCIIGDGSEVYGQAIHSVIGSNVVIEPGCVVKDSIIMNGTHIKRNCKIERSIISEETVVGENTMIGFGENFPNEEYPKIYNSGLTVVGEKTKIPSGVKIGKNCAIYGDLTTDHFEDNELVSGKNLVVEEVSE